MARAKYAPKNPAQLLSDYSAFSDDQPVNESFAAARLQKSRAWLQLKRVAGAGPRFHRTETGKIFYLKRDLEAYLHRTLTGYDNTSQYPDTA